VDLSRHRAVLPLAILPRLQPKLANIDGEYALGRAGRAPVRSHGFARSVGACVCASARVVVGALVLSLGQTAGGCLRGGWDWLRIGADCLP